MDVHAQIKTSKLALTFSQINYKLFLLSFQFILAILNDLKVKNNFLLYSSKILITINNKGIQKLLDSDFTSQPSDVLVNGISKTSTCKKTCTLENINNNITLVFTNNIIFCNSMFYDVRNVTYIDLSNFDTSKVTDFKWMFSGCRNLEKINFGNINTSLVENMASLFSYCSKLISIDLSNFDTSKVNTMFNMFSDCSSLKIINFGKINTYSVTNMQMLFKGCTSLESIDLSMFDTSQVTTMEEMFGSCTNLKYHYWYIL